MYVYIFAGIVCFVKIVCTEAVPYCQINLLHVHVLVQLTDYIIFDTLLCMLFSTRVVFLDYTMYSVNTNIFAAVRLAFEFSTTGNARTVHVFYYTKYISVAKMKFYLHTP